jgi:hypothetical protein
MCCQTKEIGVLPLMTPDGGEDDGSIHFKIFEGTARETLMRVDGI